MSSSQPFSFSLDHIRSIQSGLNEKILKKLNKSVVFADFQFVEWFNLTVGIESLIRTGGALNLKEFGPFQKGDNHHLKGLFFISQPLTGIALETLKEIIISSNFQFITIITNVNPITYNESLDYFDQVRDECLMWMSNVNYTCEIYYEKFPFAFFPQNSAKSGNHSALFFLNPFASWMSSNNYNQIVNIETYQRLIKQEMTELHTLASTSTANKDHFQQYYASFGQNELNELRALVSTLNEMLDHLDAKDDCFSLGILSAIAANELNVLAASKQRRKNASNKVSLLLIDRNIDVSSISLFQEETAFDKINNLLPNLNRNSNDVQIDLRQFLFNNSFKSILPGTLFHFSNESCRSLIESFLSMKPKECLLDVYKKLCEIYPMSDLNKDKKTFRINADSLKSQMRNGVTKANKKIFLENIDLLQIISAYCQINDAKSTKQLEFDKLISYIKVLTQNIFDKEGPSVLSRVYALFNEKLERIDENESGFNYSVSDLIILLVYIYSLIGEECFYGVEEEERIKKLLIQEMELESLKKDPKFKSDIEFLNKIQNSQNHVQLIDKFFQNLRRLKFFRKNLKQYNKLIIKDEEKNQFYYKPLVKQVCENLIKTNPANTNTSSASNASEQLLDIEYRTPNTGSEGFNLFKSFKIGSYLMNTPTAKAHPLNNDLLIIYFIGGVTSYEFKLVKEMFKDKDLGKNVLIGSSHFYNHEKLIKYVLN